MVQQIGKPQAVYDDPVNLFVAKFLGTPPVNVYDGQIRSGKLYLGGDAVMDVALPDQPVTVGIRPEGFLPDSHGVLYCGLNRIEVMGRDISMVGTHAACQSDTMRAIISAEHLPEMSGSTVRFSLKPSKVFLFNPETQKRIPFTLA